MVMRTSDYYNFDWSSYKSLVDSAVSKKYFLDYNVIDQVEFEYDAFYVSERYKLLYLPISKNASTSLKNSLDFEPIYQVPKIGNQFDLEIPEEYKRDYKIFVLIRHPKDRWISGFNEFLSEYSFYLKDSNSKEVILELKNKKFIFDGHTLPQFSFIDYCFSPSTIDFKLNLITLDGDIDAKISDLCQEPVKLNYKNSMSRDQLKIDNYELCYKIFNDYCLKQKKFLDLYKQDYVLYGNST
jgi:hypothetical protein